MELEIQRINSYTDERFHENVLKQHGAFLVQEALPYEVEITGKDSAVVRGEKEEYFEAVIEEFRFLRSISQNFMIKTTGCSNNMMRFRFLPWNWHRFSHPSFMWIKRKRKRLPRLCRAERM